jgi:hypothetical protein
MRETGHMEREKQVYSLHPKFEIRRKEEKTNGLNREDIFQGNRRRRT